MEANFGDNPLTCWLSSKLTIKKLGWYRLTFHWYFIVSIEPIFYQSFLLQILPFRRTVLERGTKSFISHYYPPQTQTFSKRSLLQKDSGGARTWIYGLSILTIKLCNVTRFMFYFQNMRERVIAGTSVTF